MERIMSPISLLFFSSFAHFPQFQHWEWLLISFLARLSWQTGLAMTPRCAVSLYLHMSRTTPTSRPKTTYYDNQLNHPQTTVSTPAYLSLDYQHIYCLSTNYSVFRSFGVTVKWTDSLTLLQLPTHPNLSLHLYPDSTHRFKPINFLHIIENDRDIEGTYVVHWPVANHPR